jgi:Globin
MVATPAMPNLSDAQIAAVKADWAKVSGQSVEVFYHFLSKFPNNYGMFKAFAGKDLNTAKGTPEFATQANNIM